MFGVDLSHFSVWKLRVADWVTVMSLREAGRRQGRMLSCISSCRLQASWSYQLMWSRSLDWWTNAVDPLCSFPSGLLIVPSAALPLCLTAATRWGSVSCRGENVTQHDSQGLLVRASPATVKWKQLGKVGHVRVETLLGRTDVWGCLLAVSRDVGVSPCFFVFVFFLLIELISSHCFSFFKLFFY